MRGPTHALIRLLLTLVLICAPAVLSAQAADNPRAMDTLRVRATAGTGLFFDVTPDGRYIIIDLYGQLWRMPAAGGRAELLADTVAVTADDRQPAISPDGRWLAARSDRPAGRGIWVHGMAGEGARQLTDSATILGRDAGAPSWSPAGDRIAYVERGAVWFVDVASRRRERLALTQINGAIDEPDWSPRGDRMLISGPWRGGSARPLLEGATGAGIWEVDVGNRSATRVTPDSVSARAPAYAPSGDEIAYFTAGRSGEFHLMVQPVHGTPRLVSDMVGIEPRRVRWTRDGAWLLFVANGKLQRVARAGGPATEVPFLAELTLPRVRLPQRSPHLAEPGAIDSARGFSGLALSPDGRQIGMLALGKLWLIELNGRARAVTPVPPSANGLTWSPDGKRVAWSAGPLARQDLWITELRTGKHRRVSHSEGSDWRSAWSPDGRWLAFLHTDWKIHLVDLAAKNDSAEIIGPQMPFSEVAAFAEMLQWLPRGDTLLVYGMNAWPVAATECAQAMLLPVRGDARKVERFPCRPSHVRIGADGTMIAVENGVLTERRRTADGWGDPHHVGREAALYPALSQNGALLYVAENGLRHRGTDGREHQLGWPVHFRTPVPRPLIVRNVNVVDFDQAGENRPCDLLLMAGRIADVSCGRQIDAPANAQVIDGTGRWAMPGLIDTHTHFLNTGISSVRAALYHGVTTVREMWHPLAESAGFRDMVAAGVMAGARVIVSGPPVYPAPSHIPSVTSDFLWIPTDSATTARGLAMLGAFGAGHVKLRYAQSWAVAGDFLRYARSAGFPAGGHCAHGLAVVAAGITTHEHADGQCGDWSFGVHEDIAALYRAAGIAVVPVIDVHTETARASRDTLRLYQPEVLPFRAGARADPVDSLFLPRLESRSARARFAALVFHKAGVVLAAGADAEGLPGGIAREMEALVQAGLSPLEALRAATTNAAEVLGLQHALGRVRAGFRADIVVLDADPRTDIRNVGRIRWVIRDGAVIDRADLLQNPF
ncbi:MAG TPA: amidohydrolase family protein [Longimicrobiales bacterium]